jgi:hypothetical protein
VCLNCCFSCNIHFPTKKWISRKGRKRRLERMFVDFSKKSGKYGNWITLCFSFFENSKLDRVWRCSYVFTLSAVCGCFGDVILHGRFQRFRETGGLIAFTARNTCCYLPTRQHGVATCRTRQDSHRHRRDVSNPTYFSAYVDDTYFNACIVWVRSMYGIVFLCLLGEFRMRKVQKRKETVCVPLRLHLPLLFWSLAGSYGSCKKGGHV